MATKKEIKYGEVFPAGGAITRQTTRRTSKVHLARQGVTAVKMARRRAQGIPGGGLEGSLRSSLYGAPANV